MKLTYSSVSDQSNVLGKFSATDWLSAVQHIEGIKADLVDVDAVRIADEDTGNFVLHTLTSEVRSLILKDKMFDGPTEESSPKKNKKAKKKEVE